MYYKFFFLACLCFGLNACLSSADVTRMTDKTYSINCTGWPRSMETCYESARSHCPNGYVILSDQPKYVANVTLLAQDISPDRVKIHGIVVQCK